MKLKNVIHTIAAAALFVAMMFVSLSSNRVFELCKGHFIYFVGTIASVAGMSLPWFSTIITAEVMDRMKMESGRVLAYIVAVAVIVAFACYILFFDLEALAGRDNTMEFFIVLFYLVMGVVGIVKEK